MEITRRGFEALRCGIGTAALISLGFEASAIAAGEVLRIGSATETTTVCPYCSVGCSAIVSVENGKVVAMEGLADSPVNRGTLCSKGQSILQTSTSEWRLKKVRVREPNANDWKEISWEEALDDIARLIKETRDAKLREGRQGRCHRQPHQGHRPPGRRGPGQRGTGPHHQVRPVARHRLRRAPGSNMTLLHGPRSGGHIRTGRHDQPLGRPAQRRRFHGLRFQSHRESPLRLEVGWKKPATSEEPSSS